MTSSIFIEGNVTRAPELTFANSGATVIKFGIAENYRIKGKNGEEDKETTSFYDVVAFGSLAENIAASINKGYMVGVQGRQEVRKFQRNDGTEGTAVEIVANFVGPSLRFATAVVTKNERASGASTYRAPAVATQQYAFDEEPF